jgi:signal peptidase I
MRKDYFISIDGDKAIISKNPNPVNPTFEEMQDLTKRYLYKEGDKIVTPFGIQTIKEIIHEYGTQHGYEWLIMVEENKNQYKPCELIGIYVKTINKNEILT